MADLPGAVIVVTGASSGNGRATALGFSRKGARLVLVSRSADALDKVAKQCADLGSEAVTFAADMADDTAVETMRSFAVPGLPGRAGRGGNCCAASYPRREIRVGGFAYALELGWRIAPSLIERLIAIVGPRLQRPKRSSRMTAICEPACVIRRFLVDGAGTGQWL